MTNEELKQKFIEIYRRWWECEKSFLYDDDDTYYDMQNSTDEDFQKLYDEALESGMDEEELELLVSNAGVEFYQGVNDEEFNQVVMEKQRRIHKLEDAINEYRDHSVS